jgi:hypothetical protein
LTRPPKGNANLTGASPTTIGPHGFVNATNITGVGLLIDTSKLKMHIVEARNALDKNELRVR